MTVEKDQKHSGERPGVDRRAFIGGLGALCAAGAWSPSHRLWASEAPNGCPVPPGFPPGIDVFLQAFQNWTREIAIDQLWTCQPQSPDDVVTLANWARKQGYTLRPRGFMHNWSPIAVTPDTTCADRVVLIDLTTNLRSMAISSLDPPAVTVQGGASMDDLLQFLEDAGFGVTSCPAPGDLSVGGVLAIGGHGTGIPAVGETRSTGQTYGSMSNRVLSITVVSWNDAAARYELKTLDRNDEGIESLLVSLGRTVITEVTLQVESNQNLRCESWMSISASELFAPAGSSGRTFGSFLDDSGRVEAIWYPFTQNPWLKVWTVRATKPFWAREVNDPYNYPFSDNLSDEAVNLLNDILDGAPGLTPTFGSLMWTITNVGLTFDLAWDLWGKSKNLLNYIKPTTLRTNANGYSILTNRSNIQTVLNEFTVKYEQLLDSYASEGLYPINGPVEIRVTGLDRPDEVEAAMPRSAALSALVPREDHPDWDVSIWLDLLTVPGTPSAGAFYSELEAWLFDQFGESPIATMRVEWSKGWAYTDEGPWLSQQLIGNEIPDSLRAGRPRNANWDAAHAGLEAQDPHRIFSNPFLDQLLPPEPPPGVSIKGLERAEQPRTSF
ncbi:MAG: cholesterol oxidase substrate-binding domain-containing protein [Phycisphaerales bacterium]|nr:cholesterol oxidase substrate-binding domain-containing protein [Phycisphaerales bacterium]